MEGVNFRLIFVIAASTFGSAFQHGYNTGVLNIPQTVIVQFINGTYTNEAPTKSALVLLFSIMVSMFCVGGVIGALCTPFVSERFGRQGALLLNCIFVGVAALLMGMAKLANSYTMLLLGRFIIGVNSGFNSCLVPMYLSEISPVSMRGAVGTVYPLVLVISILASQFLSLPETFGTDQLWPVLFGIIIFPTLFMVVTLPFCPESPKFLLVIREDKEAAKRALKWLRGAENVKKEMKLMAKEHEMMKKELKVTYKEFSKDPILRSALTMAIAMMLAQQLSGINVIIQYSTKILKSSGIPEEHAIYATFIMGGINVFMTLVSMVLVEVAGRRPLLLIGMAGMMVISAILTMSMILTEKFEWMSYITLGGVAGFIIMFAAGLGTIPWFLVEELFATAPRPLATSIAVSVNWFANFIVTVAFLPVVHEIGNHVFHFFTFALFVFLIYTYREIPETKNRSVEEITTLIREAIIK